MDAVARPMRQFVLKVHGRCDLSCDHCYVYESLDQSWQAKPKAMSMAVVRAAAARIGEHAAAWRLPAVRIVIHGGEPLLLGPQRMGEVLTELTAGIGAVAPQTLVALRMQTNGVRLDRAMCEVLLAHSVKIGVSLDGDRAANDRHRRYAGGASSYDQVRAALALLRAPEHRQLFGGILCTVDLRNDPDAVYEALIAEQPPQIDLLLPHATWAQPPLRPGGDPTPYATWLARIYARWLADERPVRVRMFDSLRSTAHGGPSGSEQFGTDPADLVVVDTDGSWEQADSTKVAFEGAPGTGMHVLTHPVDEVSRFAPVALRQTGVEGLSETCRRCPVVAQCGGGLYAHRYRPGNGFDNPSVYCPDLFELVARVNTLTAARAADLKPDDPGAPERLVDQVASGFGDEPTLRRLVAAELNITRALLVSLVDQAGRTPAWDLLTEAEAKAPDAVGAVLAHPYVRVFAVGELRGAPTGAGFLGEIAAAAAVRAGVPGEAGVTIRGGGVHLPTVGTLRWPSPAAGPARLEIEPGRLRVAGPDRTLTVDLADPGAAPWWRPARRAGFGGSSVLLEDADPYRDCHGWPVAQLSGGEALDWRDGLTAAWRTILDEAPGYSTWLRVGLRSVVPLQPGPAGTMRASTARDAFGSVAAAPAAPAELALALIHEFQHGKLGALLDLIDLFDPESPALVKVGWRPDPRPVEGALQGIYAHAAVADVWRERAGRDGGATARATYLRYRGWTTTAAEALRASDALTPLGVRFIDRLDASIAAWTT